MTSVRKKFVLHLAFFHIFSFVFPVQLYTQTFGKEKDKFGQKEVELNLSRQPVYGFINQCVMMYKNNPIFWPQDDVDIWRFDIVSKPSKRLRALPAYKE